LSPPPTTELLPNQVEAPHPSSQPDPRPQAAAPPEAGVLVPSPAEPMRETVAGIQADALPSPEPLPFAPGSTYTSGSGIVLEGGLLIVTNRHVIEGTRRIFVRNGTGHVRSARVVKVSDEDDLALLEIGTPFPEAAVIRFADMVDPVPGRAAVVMGFPLVDLLGDDQPALTEGIVAKNTGLSNDPKTFQMTTKINKGNSGGPVFDRQGRMMGVTVGQTDAADIFKRSGYLVEDMNIAIKADRILRFLGRPATPSAGRGTDMDLEDLYRVMLPRVVLVAAQK
jgi:S1-C subfamily serine protease